METDDNLCVSFFKLPVTLEPYFLLYWGHLFPFTFRSSFLVVWGRGEMLDNYTWISYLHLWYQFRNWVLSHSQLFTLICFNFYIPFTLTHAHLTFYLLSQNLTSINLADFCPCQLIWSLSQHNCTIHITHYSNTSFTLDYVALQISWTINLLSILCHLILGSMLWGFFWFNKNC